MSETEELPREEWTYVGREFRNGKMSHVWLDTSGGRRYFDGSTSRDATIGGLYVVGVQHKDDGSVSVRFGDRQYMGRIEDEAQRAAWESDDWSASRQLSAHRLEKSDARKSDLADAIGPLLEIARKLKGYGDRDALIAHVTREIWKA
jgi:hypothetical protein